MYTRECVCTNVAKMKTRIGLSFLLCLVLTVVLIKAQDEATEVAENVETDVNVVLDSDIAQIEDIKPDEEVTDDDYDEEAAQAEPIAEETPAPEPEEPAVAEDEIVEEPVESVKEAESVEEIMISDRPTDANVSRAGSKSRSGNYQYEDFFGNLDTFNVDGFNGGGDPTYNYGKSAPLTLCVSHMLERIYFYLFARSVVIAYND